MSFDIRNLIPSFAVDVVGVFDVDLNQVFPDGRPVKAAVKEDATFFTHPLESSAKRTDHIIFNPVEITLSVVLRGGEYRDVYKQIKQLFRNQIELVVQTKTDTYEKMYIQGIPHDETTDTYDAIIINIELKETQDATTVAVFQAAASSDTDTVNKGLQESVDPTASEEDTGSTLHGIFF